MVNALLVVVKLIEKRDLPLWWILKALVPVNLSLTEFFGLYSDIF